MNDSRPPHTERDELEAFLAAHPDTRFIDTLFVDMCGTVRGKRIPREEFAKIYSAGVQMPHTVYILNVLGENTDPCGLGFSDGDPDGTAMPVPGTLVPVPWASAPSAQVLMTLHNEDGTPSPWDPRHVAARVVERFAELGLRPVCAFELEFYLLDRERDGKGRPQPPCVPGTGRRYDATQVYGMAELDDYGALFAELADACRAQKIPASVATAEFAPGQYEINLRHTSAPLEAADHCALFRHVVRSVASRHGLCATFMSKPFADLTGNGMHLHVSMLDEAGRNVFEAASVLGSERLRHAVGGMMATMAEAFGLFVPNVNAFRRFGPNRFVPVTKSWGANNRSVALRVPAGPGSARRIEHRVPGAEANPYLVLAAVLAGAHYGLVNRIDPGEAAEGNAGAVADADLPFDWNAALERLQRASVLRDYLGQPYLDLYCETKRHEMRRFQEYVSPLEYQWYL